MVTIGNRSIGAGQPVLIVAEIGINHNGDLAVAKRLIDAAVAAGADAVKFQKRTVPVVYSEAELAKSREVPSFVVQAGMSRGVLGSGAVARLASSQMRETTNGDLKWTLEFTKADYAAIDEHCRKRGIMWFASGWDEESVDFLEAFNPPCYKVASPSLTDDGLLAHIRSKGRPVILSTGMSSMEQIEHAVDVLGKKDLVILHCTSTYPSQDHELNLLGIKTLQEKYPDVPIGYSGHEQGISLSVASAVLGACVVERHLTMDRSMWGSDQAASVEPKGLAIMVRDIRRFEVAKGDGVKRVWESELPIIQKLRRK